MGVPPNRRPPLTSAASAPDVFCRPIYPVPAPLVYINGWHGIGKETVAECLTLLLGKDKSLLVDIRSVGRDTDNPRRGSRHQVRHKHIHAQEPLLTPEHPHYFAFDFDLDPDRAASTRTPTPSSTTSTASTSTTPTIASAPPSSTSRPASVSSISTVTTTITTPDTDPVLPSTNPDNPRATAAATAPCRSENLTRLLTHPANAPRVAVLPACCPDTPAGRAALRSFEAAAARAGRLFVPVTLACAPHEHSRRASSSLSGLWRRGRGWSIGVVGEDRPAAGIIAGDEAAPAAGGGGGDDDDGGVGGGGGRLSLPGGALTDAAIAGASAGASASASGPGRIEAQQGLLPLFLAAPAHAGLTVDVTSASAFEAALQIVEFVRTVEAEWNSQLCRSKSSDGGDSSKAVASGESWSETEGK